MLFFIGPAIVLGSILGGYMPHGGLAVLWQPLELLIIGGRALIESGLPALRIVRVVGSEGYGAAGPRRPNHASEQTHQRSHSARGHHTGDDALVDKI